MDQPMDESAGLLLLILSISLLGIYTFIQFIIRSAGVYIFAYNFEMRLKAAMAFIPIAQSYLYALLVQAIYPDGNRKFIYKNMQSLKLFLILIYMIFLFFSGYLMSNCDLAFLIIAVLLILAVISLNAMCLYGLLKSHWGRKTALIVLHLILSILLPFYGDILLIYLAARMAPKNSLIPQFESGSIA